MTGNKILYYPEVLKSLHMEKKGLLRYFSNKKV